MRAAGTKRALRLAFTVLILVALSIQALRYLTTRSIDRDVDLVYGNSLESIRLLGRIGLQVERFRILLDRHVIEQESHQMSLLDAQIATARKQFNDSAREYETMPLYPGEQYGWERLKSDVAEVDESVPAILADSRQNRDEQARARIAQLEPRFAAIERDVDALVEINQKGGAESIANIRKMQVSELVTSALLSLVAVITVLLVAALTVPLVARREEELERHALEIENRNRELDAFAGRVAHDLRGPLTAISLSASRLPEQDSGVIQRGVRRMEALIDDLLSLSRIDAQLPGLAATRDVAEAVASDLGPRVKEAGGELLVDVAPARVRCSEGLLRQVLWNLGENAVKYRRHGVTPRIELVGRDAGTTYEFRVSDNGAGMSAEDARRAFEPFYRGAQAGETPGTGLGLAIVKRVIQVAGGTLTVDSKPGQGSTLRFTLPLGT